MFWQHRSGQVSRLLPVPEQFYSGRTPAFERIGRGCFNCSENISQAQNGCELVENGL
jgi:hypothetical protein